MSNDVGRRDTTFLSEGTEEKFGFTDYEFLHEAAEDLTSLNLQNLVPPQGVVNPNPDLFNRSNLNEANLQIFDENGDKLNRGQHYAISGNNVKFNDVTIPAGGVVSIVLRNVRQEPNFELAQGFQISPRGTLGLNQVFFNLGRSFKVPAANEPDPFFVLRNRVQSLRTDDWEFYDPNGTGYSQIIQFVRPGETLPTGAAEEVQIFLNGNTFESQPATWRNELAKLRGVQGRMLEAWQANFPDLTPEKFLLGAPSFDDGKFFGDSVIENSGLIDAILNIEIPDPSNDETIFYNGVTDLIINRDKNSGIIDDITKVSTGLYTFTFTSSITVIPAIFPSMDASGTNWQIIVGASTSPSGSQVETRDNNGNFQDRDWWIKVQRMGADFRPPRTIRSILGL